MTLSLAHRQADRAFVAPRSSPQAVSPVPASIACADEAWRPALIAFNTSEMNIARANRLHGGEPFDYMDRWTIASMKAAMALAPVAA